MTFAPLAEAVGSRLDYGIIIVYFLAILGFGSFFGRFTRSTRDFFFGGQKFAWWLIAMSMVATGVGSYSFIKYSRVGFLHGMSSSMSYMNDWFFIPFFMFGWLPIIYFSRVRSIPEYFERRFDSKCRFMAVIFLLLYMIGYIGFNFYTLGVAAHAVMGVDQNAAILVIAFISDIYITLGGQTAVIFTDLVQGFMLLIAGAIMLLLGLDYLGMDGGIVEGVRTFWTHLTLGERLPFAQFNKPPDFNFIGVFWQDGTAASISFLFVNQGLIMRFLAAKSMSEGRKVIFFNTLFLLPLSMIAVGNAGWIGNAMASMGLIDPNTNANEVFVIIAERVCQPGLFGFVLAALTAALMSTIDTLINAVTAVCVYDVYQPYIRPKQTDRHYLRTARIISLVTTAVSLAPVMIFTQFDSIYAAHGSFLATVSPPIIVSVFLGAFWKRYTPSAAFWSMVIGGLIIGISIWVPEMVRPFSHGVDPEGGFKFMRALFGLVVAGVVGVVITLFTTPKPESEIAGLWVGSINLGRTFFKGGKPNFEVGKKIDAIIRISVEGTTGMDTEPTPIPDAPASQPMPAYPLVRLSKEDMQRMRANEGDLLYVADARRWLGGLRSLHARAGTPHDEGNVILIAEDAVRAGNLITNRRVRVEKVL